MLGVTIIAFGLITLINCQRSSSTYPRTSTVTTHGAFKANPWTQPWVPQEANLFSPRRQQRRRESSGQFHARRQFVNPCPLGCTCFSKVVRCEGPVISEFPKNLPGDIERITIADSSITHLKKEHFQDLSSLTEVILSHNKIEKIDEGTFENLKNLQHLDLRQNSLKCIPENTFGGLTSLKVLKLNHNQIQWISGQAFEHMPRLQWFSLNGNPLVCDCHLAKVRQGFVTTNRQSVFAVSGATCSQSAVQAFPVVDAEQILASLFCSDDDSRSPPASCGAANEPSKPSCETKCSCHSSGYVSCPSGDLTAVPNDLPNDTISLNLPRNKIKSLNANSFSRYTNLRKLNLEGNEIESISQEAFKGLDRLSSLYLTSNKIKSLPHNAFAGLKGLTILYLQKNQISCIDKKSFIGLPSLRILHLSDNQIEVLDENVFRELHQLKFLYLVNNRLHCDCHLAWIPAYLQWTEAGDSQWAVCATPSLLKGAVIRNLTSDKMQCASADDPLSNEMTFRVRSRCQIPIEEQPLRQEPASDCPTGCTCSELTNRVQRSADDVITFTAPIPTAVEAREPGLKITCSNSGLSSFPTNIPKSTTELYLDNNSLKHIRKKDLQNLKNLEVLSLHHNQLTCLAYDTFIDLPNLKILLLHNNKLTCIANGTFDNINLKAVSFDENPFHCTCPIVWLTEWMRKNRHRIIASAYTATCFAPGVPRGVPISSLANGHFSCDSTDPVSSENQGKSRKEGTPDSSQENETPTCSFNKMLCCEPPQEPCPKAIKCPEKCSCKLNRVDCSGRGLTDIPEGIHEDTKDLFLEHNRIHRIDTSRLEKLTKLETLMLSYNSISEITPGAFKNLKNLRSLILSNNKIQCIHPHGLVGLKQLKVLILQNNDISALADGTLRDLDKLNNIALGQNTLHCDCHLGWLNSFFRSRFLDNGISLCSSPHAMQFKSIYHAHRDNFTCPWLTSSSRSNYWSQRPISGPISFPSEESERVTAKCSPCMVNPCKNQGTCHPKTSLNFTCSCKAPFYGERCEQRMNACFGKPCKNNGVCKFTDELGHYECICPPGFTGKDCEEDVDDCKSSLCQNGGECIDQVNSYTCKCKPGYKGEHCEESFEYCNDVNPCKNDGACIRQGPNGFKCICHDGWAGDDCSANIDDCEYNQCRNGGICLDLVNDHACKCPPGYTGKYCEKTASELAYEREKNGSSLTLSEPILTLANLGCNHHRCLNGASCIQETSLMGYRCSCLPGYSGKFCEKLTSISLLSPESYVSVNPICRGCFTPRGNLSVTFSTTQNSGVIMYYGETDPSTEKGSANSLRFFAAELFRGHVKLGFALGPKATAVAYSSVKVNDGNKHTLDIIIAGNQAMFYLDGIQNALIQASNPKISQAKTNSFRPLVMIQPIYLAGGPSKILEAAKSVGQVTEAVGLKGCIVNFYVNGEPIDFSRLSGLKDKVFSSCVDGYNAASCLGTAIGVPPGCPSLTRPQSHIKTALSSPLKFQAKKLHPRSGSSGLVLTNKISTDCRQKGAECLNKGVCMPNYVTPKPNAVPQYLCRCLKGFEGPRCEAPAVCRRHSRFSFLHDPDTGCISTNRIVIRSCSGPCQHPNGAPILWRSEKSDQTRVERRSRRRRFQQQQRDQINWRARRRAKRSLRDSLRFRTTTHAASIPSNQVTCCQPLKFKKRNVTFHCPDNGRMYMRWFRFVRKCACNKCEVG